MLGHHPSGGRPLTHSATDMRVLGREEHLDVIASVLERIDDGGGALVLRGDPGIGKSTVLDEAAARGAASGLRVLRTAGVEAEARLPFAGLHKLLRPVVGDLTMLPAPQRDALGVALGWASGHPPDPFLVGLAVLGVLTDVAARAPLLVTADDAQWLDRSTLDVLVFVARRLESDPVVLLAAVHDGYATPLDDAPIATLHLVGLDGGAAAELLDLRAPGLEPGLRERILDDAAGNPLALAELPLAAARVGVGAPLPRRLPLTARLERAFAARTSELSATARALLLTAALDEGGSLADVLAAGRVVTGTAVTVDDLLPAVEARLLAVDEDGVRFRHPLVRSAVRQAATLPERQAVHTALAGVLADAPDRRVWHRAAAALGPDEEVAAELDAAARSARRRGGTAVAVAALERAAQLSQDPERRGERLLRAAELAQQAGDQERVVQLLDAARPLVRGTGAQGRMLWLRELLDEHRWSGSAQAGASIARAEQMQSAGHHALAADFLVTAALRCWRLPADQPTRDLVVAAAGRLLRPADDPKVLVIRAITDPVGQGADVLERVARRPPADPDDPEEQRLVGTALSALGAFEQAMPLLDASAQGLRAEGRLGLLARALVSQGWSELFTGYWSRALADGEEAARLARETGQPRWVAGAELLVSAVVGLRGDEERADALASAAEAVLLPTGASSMLGLLQVTRGGTALSAGRHEEAFTQLRRLLDPADVAFHPAERTWGLLDLVEAAVHSDRRAEAEALLADAEDLAERARWPVLMAQLRCARPLLAADADADACFTEAVAGDLSAWPFLRARLQLAHGAWLRRQRRVTDSRAALRQARDTFDVLGAAPWAQRARQELRAAGETSRGRRADTLDELTAQELQIAQLAAEGLSNRQIGQRLYLSHRTVGSHLYRAFPKLGITSRAELAATLTAPS
jgi:DNA-binding NarL/FixJ family response regulator